MAGMLPGVEAARRRRFHQNSSDSNPITTTFGTRRSSFCLYVSGHEHLFTSTSSTVRNQMSMEVAEFDESRLCAVAREAKRRLDKRLQPSWRSQINRTVAPQQRSSSLEDRPVIQEADVSKLKRSGSKRLNWLKLNWKSSEQEECAVCLEQLKITLGSETIMQVPCGHKFHTKCLVPWLDTTSHCPCCRTEIPS